MPRIEAKTHLEMRIASTHMEMHEDPLHREPGFILPSGMEINNKQGNESAIYKAIISATVWNYGQINGDLSM
jgi:hypothetical protein